MITTLINADVEEYDRDMNKMYETMEFWQKHPTLEKIWFSWIVYNWYWLLDKTICKYFGHNLVDHGSYANPDSGGEGWACTRCGQSWWHQYY